MPSLMESGVSDLPLVMMSAFQYTYNGNFVKHVSNGEGTPKRPNSRIDGYIFETYNEN